MKEALEIVTQRSDLSVEQARDVARKIMVGEFTTSQIAGLLTALKTKGEAVDEIVGMVLALRQGAVPVNITDPRAVDCCGTGGDNANGFNISTAAAIIAAAAGAKVAKHGNRSVSSKCGSADVLEKCGVRIDISPNEAEACFAELGICFMFAPLFHPAVAHAREARKELGVRTIFNLLGPLANPANVKRQLIGVYTPDVMEKVCEAAHRLGAERVLVAHSRDGLDEISMDADTDICELERGAIRRYTIRPEDLDSSHSSSAKTKASGNAVTPEENATTMFSLLRGEHTPVRNSVLANSGATLYIAGIADSIADGVQLAKRALDSGAALELLEQWALRS